MIFFSAEPEENYELAVVGGGPAGLTAAIYGVRFGLRVLLFEGEAFGGQAAVTSEVENYPGFPEPISGAELAQRMAEQAKRIGADTLTEKVERVMKEGEEFTLRTPGREIRAKAVIAATGARPKKLGVPGEEEFAGRGVSYCAVCDGYFFRDKVVAVIGGGDSALDEALYLAGITNKVYLIHRRREYRAQKALVERVKAKENIHEVLGWVVEEIKGDKLVSSIVIREREGDARREIEVDGVFVYIGIVPNSGPFEGLVELDEAGFIVADPATMATRTPGLFAAGDVRSKALRQISTAVGDGAVAAHSAYLFIKNKE